jgi:hypothetical protein
LPKTHFFAELKRGCGSAGASRASSSARPPAPSEFLLAVRPFFWRKQVATYRSIRCDLSPPAYAILLFADELRVRETCEASFHALKPVELMKFKEDSKVLEIKTETADFNE